MLFNKYVNEIEYLLILFILFVPILYPLYKNGYKQNLTLSSSEGFISQQASTLLKAICCIIIPIHHYGIFFCETRIVNILRLGGGNIALVIFLLISAYGILKSELKRKLKLKGFIQKRIWKIYKPFLIISILTVVAGKIINATYISSNPTSMSDDLYIIANESSIWKLLAMGTGIIEIDSSMWFIWVTLVSYIVFFTCKSIFDLNKKKYKFLIAYTFCIIVYGIMARLLDFPIHYYRNLWALVLGTSIALYEKDLIKNSVRFFLLIGIVLGYVWVQIVLMKEDTYFIHATLGLLIIMLISIGYSCKAINNSYMMTTLSMMSYYVYLCHEKIIAIMNYYLGKTNVLPPLLCILAFAYMYMITCNKLQFDRR
jgi:membrane protein